MSDRVTITLDRADAELILAYNTTEADDASHHMALSRLDDALDIALAAAPDAPAEPLNGMVRIASDLHDHLLRVAYHAVLAHEVPERRDVEWRLILDEVAGWPEDDRIVIDVLMEQWEEDHEAMQRAAGEPGSGQ